MNNAYLVELVNQLNYDWFLKKKAFFKEETFYNSEFEIIKEEFDNPYSDNSDSDSNKKLIEISLDLNSYCWSSNFYGSRVQCIEHEESFYYGIPIDASDISSDIVDYISFTTSKYTEILAIHNFILGVIDIINLWIVAVSDNVSDGDFINFLLFFQSKTRREISKKFGHISQQVSYLNSNDSLEFNLGQEELAALLLILNKANFLNTAGFRDSSFLHFCAMYFKFKFNSSYKNPNSFRIFSKKYNELINNENPRLLDDIISRLKAAMKEL